MTRVRVCEADGCEVELPCVVPPWQRFCSDRCRYRTRDAKRDYRGRITCARCGAPGYRNPRSVQGVSTCAPCRKIILAEKRRADWEAQRRETAMASLAAQVIWFAAGPAVATGMVMACPVCTGPFETVTGPQECCELCRRLSPLPAP